MDFFEKKKKVNLPKITVTLDDELKKFLDKQKAVQKIPIQEIVKRLIRRYHHELERENRLKNRK